LVPNVDYVQGEVIVVFFDPLRPLPSAVSLTPPRFGIQQLDNFLRQRGAIKMERLVTSFDMCQSAGGRRLERTYLIQFPLAQEAIDLLGLLSEMPQLERVALNRMYEKRYYSLKQFIPDTTTEFDQQWNLHHPTTDKVDIDMPEAWAIERCDTNIVIVINDAGTMVDTCGDKPNCAGIPNWIIHPDFNHYWIVEEDSATPGKLNYSDIKNTDSNGDGISDNIIGANFAPGVESDTTSGGEPSYKLAFWRAVPTSIRLARADPESSLTWDCLGYWDHGIRVGGVAAASLGGTDVVGVAFRSKVYWVRNGGAKSVPNQVWDEAKSIVHSAIYGDVINMSWGFGSNEPDSVLFDAINFAANDSDCVLIASVGNEGFTNTVAYPSRYAEVLAVGAVHRVGTMDSLIHSNYSNYNSSTSAVDVVAPVDLGSKGVWGHRHSTGCESCIFPPSIPCNITYDTDWTTEGTSFAAPQAAGIAALIRSRFPGLNQAQVRNRIKRGAEYYWNPSASSKYGSGKVNAYRSLTEWGKITSDTTWSSVPGMPDTLYVAGDLIIESGATLTLNRGAVIRVAPYPIQHSEGDGNDPNRVEIIVHGTLCVGSAGSGEIVFESFTDTPTDDDWGGISYKPGSSGTLYGVYINNADTAVLVEEYDLAAGSWGTNKSLYLNSALSIGENYTVAESDSLIILGDTPVSITGGQSIELNIDGSLISRGSASKQPEFRSTTTTANSWKWLAFDSTSHDNVLHNTKIRHAQIPVRTYVPLSLDSCTLTDGTEGIEANASIYVDNTVVTDMSSDGIEVNADTAIVENTEITRCSVGIRVTGSGAIAVCRGSHIHDMEYYGVHAASTNRSVVLEDTRIENTYTGVLVALGADATVDTCVIRRNDTGVHVLMSGDPIVRHCVLDSNTTNGIYCQGNADITIESDTISTSAVGVFCYSGSDPLIQNSCWMKDNTVGVKCDASSPTLRGSKVTGGVDGVGALNDGDPDLGRNTGGGSACSGGAEEGGNSIRGVSAFHVTNLSPSVTISAECNYWGPSGPKVSGAVDYLPSLGQDPLPVSGYSGDDGGGDDTDRPELTLLRVHALSPGIPNPFNSSVTMRYEVPPPGGHVTIAVYDVRGRRVCTVVARYTPAGRYLLSWDGLSEIGTRVSSGVYFVRMRGSGFVKTRRIVLLK
jgi:hypothetical protein